jgi:hypothetical protein
LGSLSRIAAQRDPLASQTVDGTTAQTRIMTNFGTGALRLVSCQKPLDRETMGNIKIDRRSFCRILAALLIIWSIPTKQRDLESCTPNYGTTTILFFDPATSTSKSLTRQLEYR